MRERKAVKHFLPIYNITTTNKLDAGILIKTGTNNTYSGLIRKTNDSNFYLISQANYDSNIFFMPLLFVEWFF